MTGGSTESFPEPNPEDDANSASCEIKLTHPLHTRRSEGSCPHCWQESQSRLIDLEMFIAEKQTPFIERVVRDKVTLHGRSLRRLALVDKRDVEKAARYFSAEPRTRQLSSPSVLSDSASTYEYRKDLWSRPRTAKGPASLRSAEMMSPVDNAEHMSPVDASEMSKALEESL